MQFIGTAYSLGRLYQQTLNTTQHERLMTEQLKSRRGTLAGRLANSVAVADYFGTLGLCVFLCTNAWLNVT